MTDTERQPRRWELNEDAGMVGISGPELSRHESVQVIELKITDEMITAASSAFDYAVDQGDHDEAMADALRAALGLR